MNHKIEEYEENFEERNTKYLKKVNAVINIIICNTLPNNKQSQHNTTALD